MELDDLKKVWAKVNDQTGQTQYSKEEIADFRKARSRDFSTWIQNGLSFDIIVKGLLIAAYIFLIYLQSSSPGFVLMSIGIITLCLALIILEFKHLRKSKNADSGSFSVQEGIREKIKFLKSYYYRILFIQGVSNPIFVFAGVCFYYNQKYGSLKFESINDILIIVLILIISYLFTLPTTLSLYGYHYKVLRTSLASLEDEESWIDAISRYKKQKLILSWILGVLLSVGVIALLYLILI